jgi:hypothetical protein
MTTMNKDYCVKKAFSDIQRVSSYNYNHKRQCASSCNCSFCLQQKRQAADRALRERLNSLETEAKENRRIREQREEEYEKTLRLLNLMKGARWLRYF